MNVNSQTLQLVNDIENDLVKLGIMYRIFYRHKTEFSIKSKIEKNPGKYGQDKKIQDIVGVRIALYFMDDIAIVKDALTRKFELVVEDSQIDDPGSEIFKAIRYNLVFRLPEYFDISYDLSSDYLDLIDSTFELQIRTILSEGWHEVEHDLRYKCSDFWDGLHRENRALNGVYATLETSEWTLLKLFDELTFTHYKKNNLKAMLTNKFRLRLNSSPLDETIITYIESEKKLFKAFYKFDRVKVISCLSNRRKIPLSLANLIFIMNLDTVNNEFLNDITPKIILNWWNSPS